MPVVLRSKIRIIPQSFRVIKNHSHAVLTAFLCLLLAFPLAAQTLTGEILNRSTQQPVPFANILQLDTPANGTNTDRAGIFNLSVSSLPARLQISYLGYQTDTVTVTDTRFLTLYLRRVAADLPEAVVIAAPRVRVIETGKYAPLDFAVTDRYVFVLSKNGTFGKHQIQIFDPQGTLLKAHILDIKRIGGIEKNCIGEVFLTVEEEKIKLDFTAAAGLTFTDKISAADYELLFGSCRTGSAGRLIYEFIDLNGLRKRYVQSDYHRSEMRLLREIVMRNRLANFERDRAVISQGKQTSNMGDISAGENEALRNMQEESDFLLTVLYNNDRKNAVFADSLGTVLFNHDEGQIEFLTPQGAPAGVVPAVYRDSGKRGDDTILRDPDSGTYYVLQSRRRGKAFCTFDPQAGSIISEFPADLFTVKKAAVLSDRIYVMAQRREARAAGWDFMIFER